MYTIYTVTNMLNKHSYVGFTSRMCPEKRWMEHQRLAHNGSKFHFHCAIRKYGVDNFKWNVLEEGTDPKIGKEFREPHWISVLKPEYNMTMGGEGVLGLPYESRKRMGDRRPRTEEFKQKLRKIMTGRKTGPLSSLHRENISKAKFGKTRKSMPLTEEHKLNIAKARLGKKYGPYGTITNRTAN